MPQVMLDGARVLSGLSQLVAAGMTQHVRMNREGEPGLPPCPADDLADGIIGERSLAFADEHIGQVRILVSGPRQETIRLRGLGEVSVTRHVLDRFVDRVLVDQSSDQAMQLAWKKLSRLAEHQSVTEVSRQSLWAGVIHNRNGKHEGRYFLNSVQQMVMVVTDNPNEGPRLVTTYPVTRHFHQIEKAA